jgi:hypothetical protein
MPSRIFLDQKLEKEIVDLENSFRRAGFKKVRRPDIIRMLVQGYKEKQLKLVRKPKSKQFKFI